jgi:hypothetical protein
MGKGKNAFLRMAAKNLDPDSTSGLKCLTKRSNPNNILGLQSRIKAVGLRDNHVLT